MPLRSNKSVPNSVSPPPAVANKSIAIVPLVEASLARNAEERIVTPVLPSVPAPFRIDLQNRNTRTPLTLLFDNSPSCSSFHATQVSTMDSCTGQLRSMPTITRSLLINVIQFGSPVADMTGYREIAEFEMPPIRPFPSTPIHQALDAATESFEALCGKLQEAGIERTESVCVISTDGCPDVGSRELLTESIARFHAACRRWSQTPIVVGIGQSVDKDVLKAMATTYPPIALEQMNAEVLVPFIEKLAVSASRSRRGRDRISIELPTGMKPLE
jgi:uncharacterized protein YegL